MHSELNFQMIHLISALFARFNNSVFKRSHILNLNSGVKIIFTLPFSFLLHANFSLYACTFVPIKISKLVFQLQIFMRLFLFLCVKFLFSQIHFPRYRSLAGYVFLHVRAEAVEIKNISHHIFPLLKANHEKSPCCFLLNSPLFQ